MGERKKGGEEGDRGGERGEKGERRKEKGDRRERGLATRGHVEHACLIRKEKFFTLFSGVCGNTC